MRVLVSLSTHFAVTPDGALWTPIHSTAHGFWSRYLGVFSEVRIFARAKAVAEPPPKWRPATGEGVVGVPLPDFTGPRQYLGKRNQLHRLARAAAAEAEAVILRVACPVGTLLWKNLASAQPYAVEVVGDPYDSMAPGSIRHPLRPFFRWYLPHNLRRQCRGACAAAYVTEEALQRRYPCPNFSTGVSDVVLTAEMLVPQPRPARAAGPLKLVYVGTLAQLYKAPDVLIEAVGKVVQGGRDIRLTLLGDGKHRTELAARAEKLGVGDRVRFLGHVSDPSTVRAELDAADLFVLPSRQEGLPRALVEAMARGLPAIGSTVGGFGELLAAEDLVAPGDVRQLAEKISAVCDSPARLQTMSRRNLARSADYLEPLLAEKRRLFYQAVLDRSRAWVDARR